jgi:hypothetical protein
MESAAFANPSQKPIFCEVLLKKSLPIFFNKTISGRQNFFNKGKPPLSQCFHGVSQ